VAEPNDTVLAALSWLSRLKLDVVNLSLGAPAIRTIRFRARSMH
jgi:hypothetical protein